MKSLFKKSVMVRCHKALSMSTLSFNKFGAVNEVLSFSSSKSDSPAPAENQVKVSVKASQISSEDIRAIRGLSFANKKVGIAGNTAVGVVTGVANGDSEFSVNDSVLVVNSGLWTNETTVAKSSVTKLTGVSSEDAATLPSYLSAWALLNNFVKLSPGDVVVQSSGESALGVAISQVGKALGFSVISPSKAELADPKVVSNLKSAHKSIKLAISDRCGRVSLDLARSVDNGGAVVVYNGVVEPVDHDAGVDQPAASAIYKNVSVLGFDFGTWHATDASGFKKAVSAVSALGVEKKLSLKPKVFAAADYKKALTEVQAGSPTVLKF